MQATEASEIFEQLGSAVQQEECLVSLALLPCQNKQLDTAEEAGSRVIDLLPKNFGFARLIALSALFINPRAIRRWPEGLPALSARPINCCG